MRRILAVLVLAAMAACGGGSDATSPSNTTQNKTFTGTYALQTINGKALPYTFNFSTGDYLTIRGFNLTIGSAGSWTATTNEVFSTGGQVTDQPNGSLSGTYSYDASSKAVSITSTDQSIVLSGTVSADLSTLTVSESSDLFVFKK